MGTALGFAYSSIVATNLGWRAAFFLEIPLMVPLALMALFVPKEFAERRAKGAVKSSQPIEYDAVAESGSQEGPGAKLIPAGDDSDDGSELSIWDELRNVTRSPVYLCSVAGYAAYTFVTMVHSRWRRHSPSAPSDPSPSAHLSHCARALPRSAPTFSSACTSSRPRRPPPSPSASSSPWRAPSVRPQPAVPWERGGPAATPLRCASYRVAPPRPVRRAGTPLGGLLLDRLADPTSQVHKMQTAFRLLSTLMALGFAFCVVGTQMQTRVRARARRGEGAHSATPVC